MHKAYRVYVTDALRLISENTAKYGGGNYMNVRFADLFERKKPEKLAEDDPRSAVEITREIWRNIRSGKRGGET